MDLQEIYKKETGFDVGKCNIDNTNYYSEDYVDWLEKRLHISDSIYNYVIRKPKDPYHDLDRKICRDCNGTIEQTDLSE